MGLIVTVNYDLVPTIRQGRTTLKDAITDKYPEEFRDAPGSFPGAVHLSTDETVAPEVSATCWAPVSIKPHLQQTLQELEQRQIITTVDELLLGVYRIVVAQKKSGEL
ncbi:hypothetical protein MRX96_005289 [Rhipicephalus microplus]